MKLNNSNSNINYILASIVIPTYNRIDAITLLLESLDKQNNKNFNVIISNDGSTEEITKQLSQLTNKYTFPLKVITQKNSGRAAARNYGTKESTSDLIIFLDDDMLIEPNFIDLHLNFHSNNNNCILIGSGLRNPDKSYNDFIKYIIAIEQKWKNKSVDKQNITFQQFFFTACNMSISKSLFNKLNGFDERLKDAEDFDLGARALKEKLTMFYHPANVSWHNDFPDIKTFINRHNEYNKGKNELLKLHPDYLILFSDTNSANKSSTIKKILLFFFKRTFSHSVILNDSLFKILPLKLKFIFYKATISAYSIEDGN